MKFLKNLLSVLALALLHACGGGGSAPPDPQPTTPAPTPTPTPADPPVSTYGAGVLPGRLLVNAPDGRQARLFNLTTGEQRSLPLSSSGSFDVWSVSQDGQTLARWTRDDSQSGYPVSWFDAASLAPRGSEQRVSNLLGLSELQLSAGSRYVLAQYGDGYRAPRRLTVFDAQSFALVKQGSQLDGADVVADPQAWLPDGRYVYLRANELWVSSPQRTTSELLARLALPSNDAVDGSSYVAGQSSLAVSPDGSRIAFTWRVRRGNGMDTQIFTARIDGSELRQMTAVADAADPLSYAFGSPTWSPDGQWVAFVLYMNGATAAPVWPDDRIGAARVIGTTGCDASPVYVLPASQATARSFQWPAVTPALALKVRAASGDTGQWVTSCATVRWLP